MKMKIPHSLFSRAAAILLCMAVSTPAFAGYLHLNAGGSGRTYQQARAYAAQTIAISCGLRRGHTGSMFDTLVYQDVLGWRTVNVAGTCFIP